MAGKLELAGLDGQRPATGRNKAHKDIIPLSVIGKGASLHVQGKLDSKHCKFILDTGASRSVVRPDMIRHAKALRNDKLSLKTASGELLPVEGEVWATMEVGGAEFRHKFLVAKVTDECIIGLDFMHDYGCMLNLPGGTLKCGNIEIPISSSETEINTRRVILLEKVSVPPKS